MKVSLKKKVLILILCLIMVFIIAACSERQDENIDGSPKQGENRPVDETKVISLQRAPARNIIRTTIANKDRVQKITSEQWYHIDVKFDYFFENLLVNPSEITKLSVVIKGNINMEDNTASQLFFEIRNVTTGELQTGFYYYQGVSYLVLGDVKFYLEEINITEIVRMIDNLNMDPAILIAQLITGDIDIEVAGMALGSVLELFLFDINEYTQTISADGKNQSITTRIKSNEIFEMIMNGRISIPGMDTIYLSWLGLDMPNFDPLMHQLLGFGLDTIVNKKWPKMDIRLSSNSTLMPVLQPDNTYKDDFVVNGFSLIADTPIIVDNRNPANSQLQREFYLKIDVTPLRMGYDGGMVPIDFSRTPLGQDSFGTVYNKGSLLNIDTSLSFTVENENNTQITINDIIGDDIIDLGTVGLIPLTMPTATSYDFNIDIKINFDFFDNTKNRGEFYLTFQGEKFIRGYLMGDTLYLDMSALTDQYGRIIPDIKLSDIDITDVLFGSEGLLMFLDPHYINHAAMANVQNQESQDGDLVEGSFDIMAILSILLSEDNLYLPGYKTGGDWILNLDTDALSELISIIIPGASVGMSGITITSSTASLGALFNNLTIDIDISEDFRANAKVNHFIYMFEPVFDFTAINTQAKRDAFVDVKDVTEFNLFIRGDFVLGQEPTIEDGILIGLDGLIADLTQKLFLSIGVVQPGYFELEYEINANVDVADLGRLELTLIIYVPENVSASGVREEFILIYYDGIDDVLFVDLSNIHNLDPAIPMLNVIGNLPKFYVEDLGLSAMLSSILSGDTVVENGIANALQYLVQEGIDFSEADNQPADPLEIIGSILGAILIDNYSVNILANTAVLTALFALLGMDLDMPEVNASLQFSVYKVDDGYLKLHAGILDTSGQEAIYMDFCIIREISLLIGRRDIASNFDVTTFNEISTILDNLNIAVEFSGMFSIDTENDNYQNDFIDGLLSGFINDLVLRLNLEELSMFLGYTIRGNIDINDIMNSQFEIILYDNETDELNTDDPVLLAIYMKNRNLYLDLSYFGLPRLGITNIEPLLGGLLGSSNDVNNTESLLQNQEIEDSIKIQLLINPKGLSVSMSNEIISALLGVLGLNLPVEFNYLDMDIITTADASANIRIGVEGFDISIGVGNLYIGIEASEKHNIVIPHLSSYNMTDSGLPLGVYVELNGYLFFRNQEEFAEADLSPLLAMFLNDIDLNLYLQLLGIADEEVYYTIKAYVNLLDMANSIVNFSLHTSNKNILNVYYENGDLYLDTDFLDIGQVIIKNVGNIFTNTNPDTVYGEDYLNAENIYAAKSFLDLIFYDGGIAVKIAKDVFVSIFMLLGLDLGEIFEELDIEFSADIAVNPLNVEAKGQFASASAGFVLDYIDVKWQTGLIERPVGDYIEIEEFSVIGIELSGEIELDVHGNGPGVRMDYILGTLGFNSDFGILFQVLGDSFGGKLYYTIRANIDIININNLNLALYLSDSPDAESLGNVISMHVLTNPISGAIDVYLDATALGLEKIWINDVNNVISMFAITGLTPIVTGESINNAESGSTALLPNIIIGLSTNTGLQESLLSINLTTGAIYSLFSVLFGLDLSIMTEDYQPELRINLIGDGYVGEIDVEFNNLFNFKARIEMPTLSFEAFNVEPASYGGYTEINQYFESIKITLGGEINLEATQTDSETQIDFTNLIIYFLQTTDFGAIIRNLETVNTTIYYTAEIAINIKTILSGDIFNAFTVKFIVSDDNGNTLIAIYLENGILYIDLEALNIGKVRIDDVFSLFDILDNVDELTENVGILNSEVGNNEGLAAAYVLLQLSNQNGVYVNMSRVVFRVLLNSFALPGDMIVGLLGEMDANIHLGNGGRIASFDINVATYRLEVVFDTLKLDIANHQVNIGIDRDAFAPINEIPSEIYAKINLTFNIDMDPGAKYDFTNLVTSLVEGSALGFDIAPVLEILEKISNEYVLSIEAILRINDILSSDFKLVLSAVRSDGSLSPVLSLYYINQDIYIDAEAFNIQRVKIENGISFFESLFVTNNPVPLGNTAPISNSEQAEALASIINVHLNQQGLAAHIGSSALFAVLGLIGVTGIQDMVDEIGDLNVLVELFSDSLFGIEISFLSYDLEGNPSSDKAITFGAALSYEFRIDLAPQESLTLPSGDFALIKDNAPIISLATTIELYIDAEAANIPNIYGEPLSGLINSLISDLIFDIALQVAQAQSCVIVLDIKAQFNSMDIRSLEMQIEVLKDSKLYARLTIMAGNLYIDLSHMSGPMIKMPDVLDALFGSEEVQNGIMNAEGTSDIPFISVAAEIERQGLFVYAHKQVFDIVFAILNLNEFTMMNNIHAVLSAKPNADINSIVLGLEIGVGESQDSNVFTLGVAINGLRVNFAKFSEEELLQVNSTKFNSIEDINMIRLQTTLEFSLTTRADDEDPGYFGFKDLLASFLDTQELLDRALAPRLEIANNLGDTIVVELEMLVPFENMIEGLQVRAYIYSKSEAHLQNKSFDLELIFINNNLYLDGDNIGLSKIYGQNIPSLISRLFFESEDGEVVSVEEYYAEMFEVINSEDPVRANMAKLLFTLDKHEGLVIAASTEMILTALGLVGLDLTPYISNLIEPKLGIALTPDIGFKLGINLNSAVKDSTGIDIGFALVGQTTKLNTINQVIVNTITGPLSNVPPLITEQERAQYTDYADLNIYIAFSVVVDLDFSAGDVNLNNLLFLILDGLEVKFDIREDHIIRLNIDVELGINLNKILSKDPNDVDESVILRANVSYAIYTPLPDGGEEYYFSQTVATVFNYGTDAGAALYVRVDAFGSVAELIIPRVSIGQLITEFIDLSFFTDPYEDNNSAVNNSEAFGLYNTGGAGNDLILQLKLDNQGLVILITAEILATLERLLSREGTDDRPPLDLTDAITGFIDQASLGFYYSDGLNIGLNFVKAPDPDQGMGGYNITITILDNLVFDTNGLYENKKYNQFYNEIRDAVDSGFFSNYLYTDQINNRFTIAFEAEFDVDFLKSTIDWSELFSVQEIDTEFLVHILNRMQGTVILELTVDIDIGYFDKLAMDVQLILREPNGNVIFALYIDGSLNRPSGYSTDPDIYIESDPMGIPKLKLDNSTFVSFLGLDLFKLLGIDTTIPQDGINNQEGFDEDEGPSGVVNIGAIFDSITLSKGTLGIKIAQNVLASILNDLFGFDFAELGDIELTIDVVTSNVVIDMGIDVDNNLKLRIDLRNISISPGPNNIFEGRTFSQFRNLSDYKFETIIDSRLTIEDSLFSLFDLRETTAPLLSGIGVVVQAGDRLNMELDFRLTIFVDFGNLSNLRFELEIRLFDKIMARITYIGSMDDGVIYLQLDGMSLPNMKLSGINIGELVRGMLSSLGEEDNGQVVQNSNSLFFSEGASSNPLQLTSWLSLMAGSEEVSLAISGALAISLLGSVIDGVSFPNFDRFKIGYSKNDDLAGLLFVLTQNGTTIQESFRIKYNFNDIKADMALNVASTIDPDFDGDGRYITYHDIGILDKIGISLDAEVVLKTRRPQDGKSEAITGLEALVAGLLDVPVSAIDLDLQDSYLVYGISLGLYIDLANLANTKLSLEVMYNGRPVVCVYYFGETNTVYADLSGLGLFRASITGLDLMSLVGGVLTGFEMIEEGKGLNLEGLVAGMLPGSGDSVQNAYQPLNSPLNSEDTFRRTVPTIKVVVDNRAITVLPNIEVLGALLPDLGIILPPIANIAASMNFYQGFNNASVNIKLDTGGNDVSIIVPQGGLRFAIGNAAEDCAYVPSAAALQRYGGVAGINLNDQGMNLDTFGLINSIFDSIDFNNLDVYLEKRNHYWQRRDLNLAANQNKDKGVRLDPNSIEGFDNWGNFSDTGEWWEFGGNINGYNRTKLRLNRRNDNSIHVDFWQIENRAARSGIVIKDSGLYLVIGTGIVWNLDISGLIKTLLGIPSYIPLPPIKVPIPVGSLIDATGLIQSILPIMISEFFPPEAVDYKAYGNLYGKVTDENTGNPVEGAMVVAEAGASGVKFTTYTNKDGDYSFIRIPVETNYRVTISNELYRTSTVANINVRNVEANKSTEHNVALVRQDNSVYDNVRFHGRVIDNNDNPLTGIKIFVGGNWNETQVTDENGRYDFVIDGLIGSTHAVRIGGTGTIFQYTDGRYFYSQENKRDIRSLNLQFNYKLVIYEQYLNTTVTGTVIDYYENVIAGATVEIEIFIDFNMKKLVISTETGEDGVYTFEKIPSLYGKSIKIKARMNGYHTEEFVSIKTENLNNNGVTLTHNLTLIEMRTINFKGKVVEGGSLANVSGANVMIYNRHTKEYLKDDEGNYFVTESDGSYDISFDGDGRVFDIHVEKPGFYIPRTEIRTYVSSSTQIVTDFQIVEIKDINFTITVQDTGGNPIAGATIYRNNDVVSTNEQNGVYTFAVVIEEINPPQFQGNNPYSVIHDLRAFKDGYELMTDDVRVITTIVNGVQQSTVARTFTLRLIDSGRITGELVDEDGNAISDVEIYLAINGKTLIHNDGFGISPINFANHRIKVQQHGMTDFPDDRLESAYGLNSAGRINLERVPLNVPIVVKFRSAKYQNMNFDQTIVLSSDYASNSYNMGTIVLNKSPLHWTEEESDVEIGMISKVRIRLGADILDANHHNNDLGGLVDYVAGEDRNVRNRLNHGFETGASSSSDDVSYVEIWLNPMFINDMFGMVHNLILPMIAIMPIEPGSVVMPHDLITSANVSGSGSNMSQRYNENDMSLFDYRFDSYGEYLATYKNAVNKVPAGIIGWVIGMFIEDIGGIFRWIIDFAAYQLLGELLDMVSSLLAHFIPFQDAYSMIQTQGTAGNPLNAYSSYLEKGEEMEINIGTEQDPNLVTIEGVINKGTEQDPNFVKRKIEYFDLAAYAKITLDYRSDSPLERISLLLNGATYQNQVITYGGWFGTGIGSQTADNGQLDPSKGFAPKATSIQIRNIVVNGNVNQTNLDYMYDWIKYSIVNSYIIIKEYDIYDNSLINQYFIFDNYGHQKYDSSRSIKDDAYMEIDIDLSRGIGLRVANPMPDSFFNLISEDSKVNWAPPSEIIFNDPYDLSDFTFIGGTWAQSGGNDYFDQEKQRYIRTNTDPSKTPIDYLPNRVLITFVGGTSYGNNGVHVSWDMSAINFNPEGTNYDSWQDEYYLLGHALNQTYGKTGTTYSRIKVNVTPRIIEQSESAVLRNLPAIDPLNFNEAKYIAMLPNIIHYDFQKSIEEESKYDKKRIDTPALGLGLSYVFDKLEWDLSDIKINYNTNKATFKLTYSFEDEIPVTIDIEVDVFDRTIVDINTDVLGSESGLLLEEGIYRIVFDPFKNQDPRASLRSVQRLNVKTSHSDTFISWNVISMDISAIDAFNPQTEIQGPFNVVYTVEDDFGRRQNINVEVRINSKDIKSTDLFDQRIAPYGQEFLEGSYTDTELVLPDTVEVTYGDGTKQQIAIPLSNWNVPNLSYTFDEPGLKNYPITTILGAGEAAQEIGFNLRVYRRELISIAPLELDSVVDVTLPTKRLATFYDGITYITKEVDVEWAIDQSVLSSSFAGATYYSDITVNDELFGSQTLRNLRITVSQTSINSLILPDTINPANKDIIPFIGDVSLNQFFNVPGYKIAVEGTNNVTLNQDNFDIVSWRYAIPGGINLDGSDTLIIVTIGNKGYKEGNQIWSQEVFMDLSNYVLDVSTASINTVLEIDPYDYQLPTSLTVTLADSTVLNNIPCVYNLGNHTLTLFKIPAVDIANGITIGSGNNQLKFELNFVNTNPRAKMSIEYVGIDFDVTEIEAFDTEFSLPTSANVTFDITNDTEVLNLPVTWTLLPTFTEYGGVIQATCKIGNATFGYIDDIVDITIAPETVIESDVPDTIIINPYGGSVKAQMLAQGLDIDNINVVTTLRGEDNPRVMNAPMPNIPISYNGNGEGQIINFMVGVSSGLGTRVQKAVPVNVIVEERIAVGVIEVFEGTVYEPIDFSNYTSLTILFQNGVTEELPIVNWKVDNLRYRLIGGRFVVKAVIGSGNLTQDVDVEIIVKPSRLVNIFLNIDDAEPLQEWVVDPYEGFVNMPTTVYAEFLNTAERKEVSVDWTYSHIANAMSIYGNKQGGDALYNQSNNMAALASVYMGDSDQARQSIEIPVRVLNKEYESIWVSKSTDGDDFVLYSSEIAINPYLQAYSESFASQDFAYYRRVKLQLKDGDVKVFALSSNSYNIYDANTMIRTNTNNLYTGRDVIVEMTYGASGGSIARDAMTKEIMNVTIRDMTYKYGLEVDEFFIDVYGVIPEADTEVVYTQGDIRMINSISDEDFDPAIAFRVTYDDRDINVQFDDDENLLVKKGQQINFNKGTGRLYATYGNEFGGYQTVIIPVNYYDRKVVNLFDKENEKYYDAELEAFVIDPYEFNKETFMNAFPVLGNVEFGGALFKELDIVWDSARAQAAFTYSGVSSRVYATIGSGNSEQTIQIICNVMDRRVKLSLQNEGIQNVIRPDATLPVKPYDYLQYTNVAARVTQDLFAPGTVFTVHTNEGEPLTFTYNGYATNQHYPDSGKSLILADEEQGLRMYMIMDTGMSLNHRGGYLRFFLTIPGFASGEDARQEAALYVEMEEQYIVKSSVVEYLDGGGTQTIGWAGSDIEKSADNEFTWNISNPYTFIMSEDGIQLPEKVRLSTQNSAGNVNGTYIIEPRWTNSSQFRLNVNYDDQVINTAFAIELDGQSFGLTFNSQPYILTNTLLFRSLFTRYGAEDIIHLPGTEYMAPNSPITEITDNNTSYTLLFDNGKEVEFKNIGGSGNRYSSNRWNFTEVWFDDLAGTQEVTLRLGGHGGQIVRWQFGVSSRTVVNYTLQSLYVARRGQAFSINGSANLPQTVTQYFSDGEFTTFGVSYVLRDNNDPNPLGVGFNASTRTVTANNATPHMMAIPSEPGGGGSWTDAISGIPDIHSVGIIRWIPDQYRAYPSDEQDMGEDMFFSVYEDKGGNNTNSQHNCYLFHPDEPMRGYFITPGLGSDYAYVENIYIDPNVEGKSYVTNSYVPSGGNRVINIPELQIKAGTRFDFRNLPVFQVRNERTYLVFFTAQEDYSFYMPWSSGQIRYLSPNFDPVTGNKGAASWGDTGNLDDFGMMLSGGYQINTTESNIGGLYTFSTSVSLGGINYQLHVKLRVVQYFTN